MLALLFLPRCSSIPAGRSAVDTVSIDGTDEVSSGDVAEKIATSPSPRFVGLFQGLVYDYEVFDRLTLGRDLARIQRYYRARGFYEARVRAGRVIQVKPDHVRVEIVVDEGKPILVRHVVVRGTASLPLDVQKKVLKRAMKKLGPGERFDEDDFVAAEATIKDRLTDDGYALAEVKRDALIDLVNHAADLAFDVTPGPPCTYGAVTIDGLGSLPDAPVRRALDIQPGGVYSSSGLDAARQAALDLGVFSSVQVVPDLSSKNADTKVIPVRVKVEPAKLRTVKLGGGVEFDAIKTDVHAIIGWENHNFFGGMRQYSIQFKPGVVLYPLRVGSWVTPERLLPEFKLRNELRQPGFIEARTSVFIRPELNMFPVLLRTRIQPTDPVLGYLEFKNGIGLDRVFWKLYASVGHNLQVEYPFSYKGQVDPALRTLVISYPELITNLNVTDNRVRPHKGFYVGDSLQVAGGPFGGVATDFSIQPDFRGYIPLGKHVTLAARASFGFLFPSNYGCAESHNGKCLGGSDASEQGLIEQAKDLQVIFFRGFFAGGPNSDRGYPLRGIGPSLPLPSMSLGGLQNIQCTQAVLTTNAKSCEVPVGGFTRWEASVEARFDVTGPISMAVFFDSADVSPNLVDIRTSHPHLSTGLGARYDTPVGPVRLDVGYRIPGLQILRAGTDDEPTPEKLVGLPIALAFGIGEAF